MKKLLLSFMFIVSFSSLTFALTFVVNNNGDTDDANTADNLCADSSGNCTLRAAIQQANVSASDDIIEFSSTVFNTAQTITLTNGELEIKNAGRLTINGSGANLLQISGNNTSRVFFLNTGANLTINGLTITKGNGTGTASPSLNGFGGGILNSDGKLTLTNSTVSGNMAFLDGGGIYNPNSPMTLMNSTVSGNVAASSGGGIANRGNINTMLTLTNSTVSGNTASNGGGGISNIGTLTLMNSTVSGNTANSGGGIYNPNGTTTLTNSTVSSNTASRNGGGIDNSYAGSPTTLTLFNSTVSSNWARLNGGIYNTPGSTLNLTSVTVTQNKSTDTPCTTCAGGIRNFGTATLKNTIVAGNTVASASSSPDFGGAVAATSSYNLIGNSFGTTGVANGDANSNQVGVDPLLDPTLQLNGGTTPNHSLLAGSPAIDKGNSFGLTTDQRGFTRPVDNPSITNATGGDGADIGAFEVQAAPTAASVGIGGKITNSKGRGIFRAIITLTDSNGESRFAYTNPFGYYRFDDVTVGNTYILAVKHKSYAFTSQFLSVVEDYSDLNFTANERGL